MPKWGVKFNCNFRKIKYTMYYEVETKSVILPRKNIVTSDIKFKN